MATPRFGDRAADSNCSIEFSRVRKHDIGLQSVGRMLGTFSSTRAVSAGCVFYTSHFRPVSACGSLVR